MQHQKALYGKKMLSKLVKSNIYVQDPSNATFNLLKYELSDCEKKLFDCEGLNFRLPPKYLDFAD